VEHHDQAERRGLVAHLDQAELPDQQVQVLEHQQVASRASVLTPQDQAQQAVVVVALEQPVLSVRVAREASLVSPREPSARNLSRERLRA
jgi:hypothetical protein